jgi:hypothetical protein
MGIGSSLCKTWEAMSLPGCHKYIYSQFWHGLSQKKDVHRAYALCTSFFWGFFAPDRKSSVAKMSKAVMRGGLPLGPIAGWMHPYACDGLGSEHVIVPGQEIGVIVEVHHIVGAHPHVNGEELFGFG